MARSLKKRIAIVFKDDSKTEQSHRDDVNINNIMAKARRGQMSDYIREFEGKYGDTTSLQYHEAQNIVAAANQMFEQLPSELRNKFENEPRLFLDFVQNPDNKEELIKLKLAKPEKPTDPPPTDPPPTDPLPTDPPPT